MKYVCQSNYQSPTGEISKSPSKTIPGQADSIEKLIEKQKQGFRLSYNGMEYTDEDEPLPTIKDLTDIDAMQYKVRSIYTKVNGQIAKAKSEKKAEE